MSNPHQENNPQGGEQGGSGSDQGVGAAAAVETNTETEASDQTPGDNQDGASEAGAQDGGNIAKDPVLDEDADKPDVVELKPEASAVEEIPAVAEEGIEIPEPEMRELGVPDMIKPIYALGIPGQPFIEKVQGFQTETGVLVRWNNATHFFAGARLEERSDGAYTLRGA